MNPRFEPCPPTGSGVHRWFLSQANRCRLAGMQPATTFGILRDGSRQCGRPVPDPEIQAAVQTAYTSDWTPPYRGQGLMPSIQPQSKPWPEPDPIRIAKITDAGAGLAYLWEESPVRFDDNDSRAEELAALLFPGDPLLCIAKSLPADAATAPRSEWRGKLASLALIVPSPMSALTGTTKNGKESPRCLTNVGPRRFLVIEFDTGTIDSQAARLLYLREIAPLTLAVHSGGKSIHGWFFCAGVPEADLRCFMRRCVQLGADPATWTRCQMVRLPDGTRDNGRPQRVFYFNPATLRAYASA